MRNKLIKAAKIACNIAYVICVLFIDKHIAFAAGVAISLLILAWLVVIG